jgi:hypothetical protein
VAGPRDATSIRRASAASDGRTGIHVPDRDDGPRAGGGPSDRELAQRLSRYLITDGQAPTSSGVDGEVLYPLDFAGGAGTPSQAAFSSDAIAADLDRLSIFLAD